MRSLHTDALVGGCDSATGKGEDVLAPPSMIATTAVQVRLPSVIVLERMTGNGRLGSLLGARVRNATALGSRFAYCYMQTERAYILRSRLGNATPQRTICYQSNIH